MLSHYLTYVYFRALFAQPTVAIETEIVLAIRALKFEVIIVAALNLLGDELVVHSAPLQLVVVVKVDVLERSLILFNLGLFKKGGKRMCTWYCWVLRPPSRRSSASALSAAVFSLVMPTRFVSLVRVELI